MLHKRLIAYRHAVRIPEQNRTEDPLRLLAELVYQLSTEFSCNPQVHVLRRESSVWILYRGTGYDCEDFLLQYGLAMALISQKIPVTVYGMTSQTESGELYAQIENQEVQLVKTNVSGKDFDSLSDLCIKAVFSESQELAFLKQVLDGMDYRNGCVAVARRYCTPVEQRPVLLPDFFSFFRYLVLDEKEAVPCRYLNALTIAQIADLWEEFLRDRITAVEFEYAYRLLEKGQLEAFSWELALRIALEELSWQINYDSPGFCVSNERGETVRFDFASVSAAEKLFLKLLFPAVPAR